MPEVVARVNWFKMQAKNGAKTPPEDTLQEENRTTSQVSPQNSTLQDITQDEIAALITRTLRNKPTAAEVASLTTALLKIKPQLAESERTDKPDPAAVIAYVASFAGMAGKQIIGELGGPRLLVERMCQVLAQTPAQMRDMFQSVVDQNVSQ
jgi:hypothetical protein